MDTEVSGRQEILVVPRKFFDGFHAFIGWGFVEGITEQLEATLRWCDRLEAEESTDWIQPIACAVITDFAGRYCVFRRVKRTRDDLKGRVTLVVGGHVEPHTQTASLSELLMNTLLRELDEEVGIGGVDSARPLGVIIDNSTLLSSRHVGFLYEIVQTHPPVVKATEEFSIRSRFNGNFLTDLDLVGLHKQLDPWSRLILEDLIKPPGLRSLPRQRQFSFNILHPTPAGSISAPEARPPELDFRSRSTAKSTMLPDTVEEPS